MSFIHVVGRVTTELEMKVSHKGNRYVRFSLEEPAGNRPVQRFQVWAYGWEAECLTRWNLKPGSVLEVNGPLFVEEFTAADGYTPGVRLKIVYRDGRPIHWQTSKPGTQKTPTTPAAAPASTPLLPPEEKRIDGDREPLPE